MKIKEKREFYKMLKSGKFADMVKESAKKAQISNSIELYNIMKPLTAQELDVEQFWMLSLDAQNRIIDISMMSKGSLCASAVYPREIVKKVIDTKAAAVICVHNHPSGAVTPSPEDLEITFQLMIALSSIGVTLHEHMIVGDGTYLSMADDGIIGSLKHKYNRLIES